MHKNHKRCYEYLCIQKQQKQIKSSGYAVSSKSQSLRRRVLFFLGYVFMIYHIATVVVGASHSLNPYQILEVHPQASMEEIKKQYRAKCLKYHPDKNVHLSPVNQKRAEETFKKIQEAYTQIGNESSKRDYDVLNHHGGNPHTHPSSFGSSASETLYETLYRSRRRYPMYTSYYPTPLQRAFHIHVFPFASDSTTPSFYPPSSSSSTATTNTGPKSIFIQRVVIPLEELYQGIQGKKLVLQEDVLQRYRAAFRGGAATYLALQGFLTSLPLLFRAGIPLTLIFFLVTFHFSLPRPTQLNFVADIAEGWKEGTQLTFHSTEPGIDVVFIVVEGKHYRFTRQGDDLHTRISITKAQAKQGTTITIEPFIQSKEDPIVLKIKPGEITKSGQRTLIPGRGWPKKKIESVGDDNQTTHASTPLERRGNLVVSFQVVSDRKRR